MKKNVWRHSEATKKRKFWLVSGKNLMTFCDYIWARFLNNSQKNEDIVRLQMSEATSLRGLWLVSEKRCEDILRLYLSEAFNWILKKLKTLWGYNWVRFWLYKLEDILRIQLREVFCRLVRKEFWIHSECTSERGVWTLLKNIEAILRLQLGNISD